MIKNIKCPIVKRNTEPTRDRILSITSNEYKLPIHLILFICNFLKSDRGVLRSEHFYSACNG